MSRPGDWPPLAALERKKRYQWSIDPFWLYHIACIGRDPMIRAKLWFRCAAMHDPVTPVVVQPAVIGWEAKKRRVDLTIDRTFKGDELVMRMKGWVTADVKEVVDVVKRHGFLKVLDDRDLVVELETQKDYDNLARDLEAKFSDQMNLEKV
jgi:hypothetical protein